MNHIVQHTKQYKQLLPAFWLSSAGRQDTAVENTDSCRSVSVSTTSFDKIYYNYLQ